MAACQIPNDIDKWKREKSADAPSNETLCSASEHGGRKLHTDADAKETEKVLEIKEAQQTDNKMDTYLLQTLDEIERRTGKLRQTAREVEAERLYLLESLNTLMQSQALACIANADEKDELEMYMDRLTNRLLTINISVQIIRNPPQEESLQLVRTLLGKLENEGETDRGLIQRYLNSCMEVANGPVDNAFQGALLGCAVEDQKHIRKILTSLWEAKDDVDRQMSLLASHSLSIG